MDVSVSLFEDDTLKIGEQSIASPSSSTSGCVSGDDTSDGKAAVPASLVTAENYLSISEEASLSSVEDLTRAVEQCKDMVLDSPECSEERRWLVRRLIELRFRLQEAKDVAETVKTSQHHTKVLLGHHFVLQSETAATTKHHCDRCAGIIWSVLHSWYQCVDCQFHCHVKCLSKVCRVCAHVRVAENPMFIMDICPEVGLAAQSYRCAECKSHITFKNSWVEPRLCDYDGYHYCPNCHWNSTAVIPARVVHNWDFDERRVTRASKQILRLMLKHPVIKLQQINPRLFSLVQELGIVRKLREDLLVMKKYFVSCKDAIENRLLWQLKDRQHLLETSDTYSLKDLIDINSGELLYYLEQVQASFIKHIKTDCKTCFGRGYFCELCDIEEVIFPFDSGTTTCTQCLTAYHKNCWIRKSGQCPKCLRLKERADRLSSSTDELTLNSDNVNLQ